MARLRPMTIGQLIPDAAKKAKVLDSTDARTRMGQCPEHGQETVMRVRGRWRFICGAPIDQAETDRHPVSVLDAPFSDNIGLFEAQRPCN